MVGSVNRSSGILPARQRAHTIFLDKVPLGKLDRERALPHAAAAQHHLAGYKKRNGEAESWNRTSFRWPVGWPLLKAFCRSCGSALRNIRKPEVGVEGQGAAGGAVRVIPLWKQPCGPRDATRGADPAIAHSRGARRKSVACCAWGDR